VSTIGFTADDDSDEPRGVLDGTHTGEDSFEHEAKTFLQLCKDLRELGAVKVRAGSLRAEWPAQEQQRPQTPAAVTVVPIGPQPKKRSEPTDDELRLYPGEVLTADDKARRLRQLEIKQTLGG
jgi:hypothetical protein